MRESHVSFLDFKLAWGQSQRAILCHIQVHVQKNLLASTVRQIGLERSRKVIVRMKSSVKHTSCKTYLRGLHSNVLHKEVAHDTVAWWHCSQHRALGSINGRKETYFWRQTLLKPFTALWESLYSESVRLLHFSGGTIVHRCYSDSLRHLHYTREPSQLAHALNIYTLC